MGWKRKEEIEKIRNGKNKEKYDNKDLLRIKIKSIKIKLNLIIY